MGFLGGMRLSYGEMPSFEEFEAAFKEEVPRGVYVIRAGASGAGERYAGRYNAEELYDLVDSIKDDWGDEGDEDSGTAWASSILQSLGIEWV